MLGTYPPKNEFQMLEIPRLDWTEAPTGMMLRGDYKAKVKVCLSLATHTMLSSHTSFSPCFYLLFCFLYSLLTTTTALTLSSSTSSRSRRTGPSKDVIPFFSSTHLLSSFLHHSVSICLAQKRHSVSFFPSSFFVFLSIVNPFFSHSFFSLFFHHVFARGIHVWVKPPLKCRYKGLCTVAEVM